MARKSKAFPNFHFFGLITLGIILLVLVTIALVPEWHERFREAMIRPQRQVLATLRADLTRTGDIIQIIKVLEGPNLYIEIYDEYPVKVSRRLDRHPLTGSKNGYFNFQGESTSLALYDLDRDGNLEIITPSFERGLTARMNVFKFEPRTRTLIEVKEMPLPQAVQHVN